MIHDCIEVAAARALFRHAYARDFRADNAREVRRMLYWLGVVIDDLDYGRFG